MNLNDYEARRRLLTAIQKTILYYVSLGQKNKDIANSMNTYHNVTMTERGVEAQVSRILQSIGVSNRTKLTYWECKYLEIGQ
jgi:DNA-binding NarL/FixJ family response regulator